MELYHFKNLLDQVNGLVKRYKKVSELTGENFNVFRILKLESSEVRMHSAFIAELLNPKGSHGQKDVFLKLFVNAFCFKQQMIDTASCNVEIEKHAGFISANGLEGGRIDILITDESNHNQIIIENKIYAGDQSHQLTRYYNYSNSADILYLTLNGKEPNDDSIGELKNDIHFKCYSYKHDILNWLEQCRKEAAINPIIRESITQYINLIKYLTNQTINNTMQEELSDLLKVNLEAAFLISDNIDNACDKLLGDFIPKLEIMCCDLGLKCTNNIDFDRNYTGFWIDKSGWENVKIAFQFQSYDKDLIYGFIVKKDPEKISIPTELRSTLKSLPNNTVKNSSWWPWYRRLEDPYNNWSKFNAWKAIENETMLKVFKEKIEYLLGVSGNIDL